mmetsp:Transcript_57678/g.153702  ORF Transcript_57678/g.153702 Transcript_57678/m.153702 type:complete len:82 (-) Transcript_57678:307-552(-)
MVPSPPFTAKMLSVQVFLSSPIVSTRHRTTELEDDSPARNHNSSITSSCQKRPFGHARPDLFLAPYLQDHRSHGQLPYLSS